MKTRCPECRTIFRVTPDQLKARIGKVRCGECQSVFNALDSLLDVGAPVAASTADLERPTYVFGARPDDETATPAEADPDATDDGKPANAPREGDILLEPVEEGTADSVQESPPVPAETMAADEKKGGALIFPRETNEIPGYSRWAEDPMATHPIDRKTRWPFVLAALLLVVVLTGQVVFHFRSEIAITAPSLRPMLEAFCQALDAKLPLPSHVELVSIETSELQADPARVNLLILSATLRNRAKYEQAFPSLELSLTDTQDAAIARRVFRPAEYLSPETLAKQSFAANVDIPVRLWIEAKDVGASGYRLYVFYP